MMRPVVVTGLCLILVGAAVAGLPEAAPESVGLDPARLAKLDEAIPRAIRTGPIPGAVVLVGRNGRVALVRAYGNRAIEPKVEPLTRDTVFDMASLTKPLATATAAMILIERGQIALDAPIARYLPEFDNHGKGTITVEQLLRHRGGLAPDNSLSDYADGPEEAWKRLAEIDLKQTPGAGFIYSDVGFEILGRLIERVSGQTLDVFTRDHIYRPIGMTSTSFRPIGRSDPEGADRIAPTEKDRENGWLRGVVHDPRARALGGVAGHAGLFSTADDVALYAQTLLNNGVAPNGTRILKPETVRLMLDPGDTPPGQKRGLGWDIDTAYNCPRGGFGPRSFGHTGFTGTSLWIDPDTRTFVVLLTSRLHPAQDVSVNDLRREVATIVADAVAPSSPTGGVRCGIDVLAERGFEALKGKRVGLVTNHTGRARDGRSTIDVLAHAPDVTLVRLFSPEHGIRGQVDREVSDSMDEATGLPIVSLYGKLRKPTAESLKDLDVLVYDIQDIGARFYTYISTLGLCLEAAGEAGIEMVVLDRPNPIGGVAIGGPLRAAEFASFIAHHDIPVRHGMTVGELARMFQEERGLKGKLTVVPCEGWKRGDLYDRTGLLWVNPSPNMRSPTEAILYPGVGLLEATNLATGRGTDSPFERVGAPYIDPVRFAAALNDLGLAGVRSVPIRFRPSERQYAGSDCGGVMIQVADRAAFDPIDLGLGLAVVLRQHYGEHWKPDGLLRFACDRGLYDALLAGRPLPELRARCAADEESFRRRRRSYLLYPD